VGEARLQACTPTLVLNGVSFRDFCGWWSGPTTIALLVLGLDAGPFIRGEKTKIGNRSGVVGVVCYEYHIVRLYYDEHLLDVHE